MVSLPDPHPPASAKSAAVLRRDRRLRAEELRLDGYHDKRVIAMVSEQFGVSACTVKNDLRVVRRQWAREDAKHSRERRQRVIRGLERVARRASDCGDLAVARQALRDIGYLLGMGPRYQLDVNVGGKVTHVHQVADPGAWLPDFVTALSELGLLQQVVPAQVLPAQTNGHESKAEGNGHAA
jgi:hypothetical protein